MTKVKKLKDKVKNTRPEDPVFEHLWLEEPASLLVEDAGKRVAEALTHRPGFLAAGRGVEHTPARHNVMLHCMAVLVGHDVAIFAAVRPG